MKIFNPIEREYIAPVDLSVLQNTYNTLEQGHKEAVQASSALKQTIAQYDLNEAEDGWRQSKINEVQAILQNNTMYGNSAGAVDDLITASGDILFGPDMQGRLKAQQAYKENRAKIDAMSIPDKYKEVFKELNPYHYEDKFDENGNIIGGTTWTPNANPVATVPLNELMQRALAWAAKEKGGGSQVRWLDAQGNVTNDYKQSITGEFFSNVSGQWERLSKEKLSQALEAVIASTPGARESLNQDYFVADYLYNKGEASDILDKDGIKMNPSQYLQSKVDPFFNAASYYNYTSTAQYGDAVKAQAAAVRAAGGGTGNGIGTPGSLASDVTTPLQNKGLPISFKNTMPTDAKADIMKSNQTIANVLSELGIRGDVTKMTEEQIKTAINNDRIEPAKRFAVLQALDTIKSNSEYINSFRNSLADQDDKLKFDAYTAITSMGELDPNNPYSKKYSDYINQIYNGATSIRQHFVDNDTLQAFKDELGGEDELRKNNIKVGSINGKSYVELPKENSKFLFAFQSAAKKAYDQTHGFWGKLWDDTKNYINNNWGDNLARVYEDGEVQSVNGFGESLRKKIGNINDPMFIPNKLNDIINPIQNVTNGLRLNYNNTPLTVYNEIDSFIRDLQVDYDSILGNGGNLTVDSNVISEATPELAEYSMIMKADPTNASKYTAVYNNAKNQVSNIAVQSALTQTGVLMQNDYGILEKVNSADRMELQARFQRAKEDEKTISARQDPTTGKWAMYVTLASSTDKSVIGKKPITFMIPNVSNEVYESWNNDTGFRAINDVRNYHAANRALPIISSNMFNWSDNVSLIPNGNSYNLSINDKIYKDIDIDYTTAQKFRAMYYDYLDTKNAVNAKFQNVNPNAVAAMYLNIAKVIGQIYNTNDEDTINAIAAQIAQ